MVVVRWEEEGCVRVVGVGARRMKAWMEKEEKARRRRGRRQRRVIGGWICCCALCVCVCVSIDMCQEKRSVLFFFDDVD